MGSRQTWVIVLIAMLGPSLRGSDMGALAFVVPVAMLQIHGGARFPIGGTRDLAGSNGGELGFDFNALQFTESKWTLRPTITFSDRKGTLDMVAGRPGSELTSREIGLDYRYYFKQRGQGTDWSAGPYFIASGCTSRSSYKIDRTFALQNNVASQYVTNGFSYALGMGYQINASVGAEIRMNTLPITTISEKRLDRTIALSLSFHPLRF